MASLSQTLKQQRQGQLKRGPGGQLSQETPEEIQSLAGQAGLQAPPITPLGTALVGGTPKQQDMAGSPAQKEAALSLASQPVEQGLSGAVRRMQARSEMTGEETQQKEKSQDMMNLGSLGDRVTGFIESQKQKLQTQAQQVTAQQTLDVTAADTFQGKDVSGIKQLLDQYRKQPGNQQLLLQINQALGYDINTQLDPAKVQELYESATDTIARGAAGNVDNDLTVSDLIAQGDLGYTPEQLQDLLGVPVAQLQGLTVGQLRSEIERVGQQEFGQTAELQQKAESGTLGFAERQLARQAGREMSATGVRATEADYQSMEQQIQNADKVQFGGKEYQVDELLQDETISNIIKDYMESAPDSDIRKQLDATEPALKEFIQKNQAVLQEASGNMEAGAQEFRSIQAANKQLQTIEGTQLDNTLAAKLIPGFGTLQAQRIDPNTIPFFQAINAMPSSNRRRQAVDALNAAQDQYPDVADQLSGLSADEITKLNVGKDGGFFQQWVGARQQRDKISAIPPSDTGSLVSEAFSGENANTFSRKQEQARILGAFGLPSGLSADIRSTPDLKNQILSEISNGGLKEAAQGQVSQYQKKQLGEVQFPKDPMQSTWIQWATPYAIDGKLDADEIQAIGKNVSAQTDEGLNALKALEDMAGRGGANMDRGAVQQLRQQATNAKTDRDIRASSTPGNPYSQLDNFIGLLNQAKQDPRTLNPDTINGYVYRTVAHELTNGGANIDVVQLGNKLKAAGLPVAPLRDAFMGYLDRWGSSNIPTTKITPAVYAAFDATDILQEKQRKSSEYQKEQKAKAEYDRKQQARGK